MGRETVVVVVVGAVVGAVVIVVVVGGGAWVEKEEREAWELMVLVLFVMLLMMMLLLLVVGDGEVGARKRGSSESSSLLRRRPDAAAAAAKLGFLYFATALCTSCRDSHRPPASATAARCSGSSAPLTTCATVATLWPFFTSAAATFTKAEGSLALSASSNESMWPSGHFFPRVITTSPSPMCVQRIFIPQPRAWRTTFCRFRICTDSSSPDDGGGCVSFRHWRHR